MPASGPGTPDMYCQENLFFILDSISVYVTYIDAATLRYKYVNQAFATAYNLPREQIIGKRMKDILPETNYLSAGKYIEEVRNGRAVTYEHCFNVPIGSRWVEVDYIPEFAPDGRVVAFIVLGTDITDRRIAAGKLQKSEARYRFIVETANEGILIVNRALEIEYVNNKLASMLGYEMQELLGASFKSLVFAEHLADFDTQMAKRMQGEDTTYERYLKKKDGTKHWVIISAKAMLDNDGRYTESFAMITDIHARKLVEERLESAIKKLEVLSNVDSLTTLANRRYFDEITALEYDRLARHGAALSFIMIDIDYFKEFNDRYGHLCGDDCLRQVARVLAGSVARPADLVARYGGEEFICLLPETTVEGAGMIAERMRRGVESLHIVHEGSRIADCITISLGVATSKCTPGRQVLGSINSADKALYRAKARGRNRIEFYPGS
jgi:PAS domain S-box/diguanylate cyclase (GGDEF) domain